MEGRVNKADCLIGRRVMNCVVYSFTQRPRCVLIDMWGAVIDRLPACDAHSHQRASHDHTHAHGESQ